MNNIGMDKMKYKPNERGAADAYAEEYRRKLMQEENRRQELARRNQRLMAEAQLEAERNFRKEASLKKLEAEREMIRKRNEANSQMIRQIQMNREKAQTVPSAPPSPPSPPSPPTPPTAARVSPQLPMKTGVMAKAPVKPVNPQVRILDDAILAAIPNADKIPKMPGEIPTSFSPDSGYVTVRPNKANLDKETALRNKISKMTPPTPPKRPQMPSNRTGTMTAPVPEAQPRAAASTFSQKSAMTATPPVPPTPPKFPKTPSHKEQIGTATRKFTGRSEMPTDYRGYIALSKDLKKVVKEIDKKIKKIKKKEDKNTGSAERKLFNERIALEKEAVEILCIVLGGAVVINNKRKINKNKEALNKRIARYNRVLYDLSVRIGKDLPTLSYGISSDIIAGRDYETPPVVYFKEMDESNSDPAISAIERRTFIDAYKKLKLNKNNDKNEWKIERKILKKYGKRNASVKEALKLREDLTALKEVRKRDEEFLALRYHYVIRKANFDHKAAKDYFFGTKDDVKAERKETRQAQKELNKDRKKALKFERKDNERYNKIVAINPYKYQFSRCIFKKKIDRDKLEEIRSEMEVLLARRDLINSHLMRFYTTDGEFSKKKKIEKKVEEQSNQAKTAAMKASYDDQEERFKDIDKRNVSLDIKEDIYDMMNEKIYLEGVKAVLAEKIKHAKNEETRKKLNDELKSVQEDIDELSDCIDYAYENDVKKRAKKRWILVLVILAVLGVGIYLAYRFFGEEIIKKFQEIFFSNSGAEV